MSFEDGQVDQASLVKNARDAEAAQAFGACRAQFDPVLFAAFGVDAQDANAVFGAEFFDAQDGVGGFTVKFGARGFAEYRFGATGAHFFGDGFEQGEAGG